MANNLMSLTRRTALRRGLVLAGAASFGSAILWFAARQSAASSTAQVAPAPAVDAPLAGSGTAPQVAVLAGGCFWGVQGVYQHTKGVVNAVSGYAGGDKSAANYKAVTTGRTGHAEAVEITFDPSQISYGRLLQIFFSVVHDPTQLNRQGPDIGTQYRSAIFPRSGEQAQIAKSYIAQLNQARIFNAAIVTKIEADREFFAAEDYHQDFMIKNPTYPYIVYHDLPKVEDLKRLFPAIYRSDPVLVANARSN
jgi:peptide-methionine (S)-S-oxide reductase